MLPVIATDMLFFCSVFMKANACHVTYRKMNFTAPKTIVLFPVVKILKHF